MADIKYNPLLDVTYDEISTFGTPYVLLYRLAEKGNFWGLISANGQVLTEPIFGSLNIWSLNEHTIGYTYPNGDNAAAIIINHKDGRCELKEVSRSRNRSLDRVYGKCLVFWDKKQEAMIITDKNGKVTNEKGYLNIIYHKNLKVILGVHYIHIENKDARRMPVRMYDILDEYGNIKEVDIVCSNEQLERYGITESILYRRGAKQIEIKKDSLGVMRTFVDSFPIITHQIYT